MAGEVYGLLDLAIILVTKLLLTAICLGFGFAGGIFSPALLIGVLFGALVGNSTEFLLTEQHSYVAVYAVCGLVAVAGPVIGAPLTMVLIVFELTQNFDLAAAAMVSVAFVNLVGYRVFGRSLFDAELKRRGFDLSRGRDKITAELQRVADLLHERYLCAAGNASLLELRKLLVRERRGDVHIIDDARGYLGTLSMHRLIELDESGVPPSDNASQHARPAAVTLTPQTSVGEAMAQMQGFVGEDIPVLDDGKLVGALAESEIVGAYLRILEQVREEENAAA